MFCLNSPNQSLLMSGKPASLERNLVKMQDTSLQKNFFLYKILKGSSQFPRGISQTQGRCCFNNGLQAVLNLNHTGNEIVVMGWCA